LRLCQQIYGNGVRAMHFQECCLRQCLRREVLRHNWCCKYTQHVDNPTLSDCCIDCGIGLSLLTVPHFSHASFFCTLLFFKPNSKQTIIRSVATPTQSLQRSQKRTTLIGGRRMEETLVLCHTQIRRVQRIRSAAKSKSQI
jgi:hypothetical protein